MKMMITGAAGQLGKEWMRYASEHSLNATGYTKADLDITQRESVEAAMDVFKPDVLVNCAAYTDVDGAESQPGSAFLVNERGVKNLSELCSVSGIKLIHYSTDYVFPGRAEDEEKYPDGYPEYAETDPVNLYGESKEAGERAVKHSGCDYLMIRVSWLCGRYGSNFVKTMMRLGGEKEKIDVVDDQIASPAFAFDVVEKTIQLIRQNEEGVHHLCCDGRISWADFAEAIFNVTGDSVNVNRVSTEEFSRKAKRPRYSLLSCEKAKVAGLELMTWKEGVKQVVGQVQQLEEEAAQNGQK